MRDKREAPMSAAASKDKEQLIKHFGDLLNALEPQIESRATRDGMTVTLRFDSASMDRTTMRRLAALVADSVA